MLKTTTGIFWIIGLLMIGSAHAAEPVSDPENHGLGDDLILASGDNCYWTFWPSSGRTVEMDICERGGGSTSGFYTLKNNTNQDLNVCWEFEWNNGTRSRRLCNSRLPAGEQNHTGSCFSCNRGSNEGGVNTIHWHHIERR